MLKCSYYNKNDKRERLALSQNIHRYANTDMHIIMVKRPFHVLNRQFIILNYNVCYFYCQTGH